MSSTKRASEDIEKWIAKKKIEAMKVARGYAALKLSTLIKHSPQYSGDFAANWRLSVNDIDYSYGVDVVTGPSDADPFKQFDPQAIGVGMFENLGKDGKFKLGDKIYITNHSAHENRIGSEMAGKYVEDEYYKKILDGTLLLRDENLGTSMRAAVQQLKEKYSGPLNRNQVAYLQKARSGSHWI